ncbi:MAG TPA: hypothetical protein VN345_17145 [Blastocatellia bacterium]|jgi:hypothetical protein|nr:hypothetical protein [Blastocatellia bacterium]
MRLVKPVIDSRLNLQDKSTYVIPLGRVRQCLRVIGWSEGGFEARRFLKALRQIGAAWCIADLWIPTTQTDEDGNVLFNHVKGEFSKMTIYAIGSKHLTEEDLNNGLFNFDFNLDDTVYVLLNPIEAEIQKNQPQRYIDNQYMFSVVPAAQRWYELLAAKIFGVIKNSGSYCEVRYSWYVKHHHTLKRFYTRKRVVFQMTRLVQDHLDRGYLTKVEYRVVKDPGKEIDWIIRYYPGETARTSIARILSYQHQRRPTGEKERISTRIARPRTRKQPVALEEGIDPVLFAELAKRGVSETQARKLASNLESDQQVMDQLEWADYIVSQGAIKNPPGLYVTFIKDNLIPPDSFETSRKRRLKQAQAQAISQSQQDKEALQLAYGEYRNKQIDQYIDETPEDYERFRFQETQEAREKFAGFENWKPEMAEKFITALARAEVAKRISVYNLETFRTLQTPAPVQPYKLEIPHILLLPAPGQGSKAQDHNDLPPAAPPDQGPTPHRLLISHTSSSKRLFINPRQSIDWLSPAHLSVHTLVHTRYVLPAAPKGA